MKICCTWGNVNPIQVFSCTHLTEEVFGVMSKSSEVKSSEWKSKQPLMCYRNLSLQQDVSVILSQQHFQLYYGTNTHSGEMTSFSTFLKILHITSIMLIMIHLGKENSVCVACKESGGGKWGGKKYLKQVIYRGS